MILYNVTVGIDRDVEQEWLEWMIDVHIPDVMSTGLFKSYQIYKMLSQEEEEGPSYSIQYFAEDMNHIELYLEEHAPGLIQKHMALFKNKHVAFRSLLEKIG